ncbi:hypothetical protein MRX96_005925 [Rhipicephalus microplus]
MNMAERSIRYHRSFRPVLGLLPGDNDMYQMLVGNAPVQHYIVGLSPVMQLSSSKSIGSRQAGTRAPSHAAQESVGFEKEDLDKLDGRCISMEDESPASITPSAMPDWRGVGPVRGTVPGDDDMYQMLIGNAPVQHYTVGLSPESSDSEYGDSTAVRGGPQDVFLEAFPPSPTQPVISPSPRNDTHYEDIIF